ncbi:MAG: hypothetical protein EOO70_01580 [Myxococcaceae bacterium]|nr:MAG: hypothetical protein EOO70_01580 [Myxococcaceae bacterium]
MRDGRVFEGTSVDVVRAMQGLAFGVEHLTLGQYVAWVASNARTFERVELQVTGDSDEEQATSLVEEMIRARLARRV